MDWTFVDDTTGVLAEDKALSGFGPRPPRTLVGPYWFVTDQHPRGVARLIDAMGRDTVSQGGARIVLSMCMSRTLDKSGHVTVSTHDGRKWRAKHAISTVSFGVLHKHHHFFFYTKSSLEAQVRVDGQFHLHGELDARSDSCGIRLARGTGWRSPECREFHTVAQHEPSAEDSWLEDIVDVLGRTGDVAVCPRVSFGGL